MKKEPFFSGGSLFILYISICFNQAFFQIGQKGIFILTGILENDNSNDFRARQFNTVKQKNVESYANRKY
jgi:hypothetical protein